MHMHVTKNGQFGESCVLVEQMNKCRRAGGGREKETSTRCATDNKSDMEIDT